MSYKEENIIGYCKYCLGEIYCHNIYVIIDGDKYHIDCYEITKLNIDPLELNEE